MITGVLTHQRNLFCLPDKRGFLVVLVCLEVVKSAQQIGVCGGSNMLLAVFLVITGLFVVLGIIFASGKGAKMIAGYNTATYEEKSKTDEKKLLKAMSVFMFVLAGCFFISALSQVLHAKSLIWIGQALFAVALIAGLIYLNTGDRFKR